MGAIRRRRRLIALIVCGFGFSVNIAAASLAAVHGHWTQAPINFILALGTPLLYTVMTS